MSGESTSLDRLHDLVLPPEVPWWPFAPGWYVLLGLALVILVVYLHRRWNRWHANAYRRAALRELASAEEAPAIAELLRRTALAFAPRPVIATLTGAAWTDWLAAQGPVGMPDTVRRQLSDGIYGRPAADPDVRALSQYAALWISRHHPLQVQSHPGASRQTKRKTKDG